MAGIYITFKSTVNVGDIVEFGDHMGPVKSIGLRAVKIDTFQGQEVVIPNRLIFEDIYKHYTVNKVRRIDLNVGISYGEDLQKVEDITLQAIKKIDYLMNTKPIDLYFLEFGDSSINFVIRYWVNFQKQTDYLQALSDGIKNIKSAYDANDITIPFPIRSLDFGIKGGKTLTEVMPGEKNK
ncbi:mechanosensitive ion channel family protein [Draconibacterium halophilum]|uniref:mechanosensitive ion channel family protein n=1 Tax=Draconibacterium halophilum TaxID=2706887 RepID=UPI00193FEED0